MLESLLAPARAILQGPYGNVLVAVLAKPRTSCELSAAVEGLSEDTAATLLGLLSNAGLVAELGQAQSFSEADDLAIVLREIDDLPFDSGGRLGTLAASAEAPLEDLGGALRTVAPYLSRTLVSAQSLAGIRKIARVLPGRLAHLFGLECRLGAGAGQTDYYLCMRASGYGREILAGQDPGQRLATALSEHQVWARIRQFCREWAAPASPLHQRVGAVWLEFDVGEHPSDTPVPSIFFGRETLLGMGNMADVTSEGGDGLHQWCTQTALPLLYGHSVPPEVAQKLLSCFQSLPAGAGVYQVGVMLSRASPGVRVCLSGIGPGRIPDFLERIGWAGSLRSLESTISKFANLLDICVLDIDVAESIGPQIGLECYLPWSQESGKDPLSQRFFDCLTAAGLCLPEKREAVLAWPGYAPYSTGPKRADLLARRLSHVKIVFDQDRPLEAKAYLSCLRLETGRPEEG